VPRASVARAYVALGSNLGNREGTLLDAVEALRAEPGVEVAAVSTLIETEPVGYLDQPRFLNGVAALDTTLPAPALLELLLEVERRFGRSREGVPAQGPRTLDLDLLLYGEAEIDEPGIQVPHPRLHERLFVLGPLAELAPGLEIPGQGDVQALIARLH
jgi:2-amino-4-hydroxy-6-hydroxymethyldihydropteridine diphosphokinase